LCRRLKEGFHVLVSENGVYLLVLELQMKLDSKDTAPRYVLPGKWRGGGKARAYAHAV
jgi:hypothetical protein